MEKPHFQKDKEKKLEHLLRLKKIDGIHLKREGG